MSFYYYLLAKHKVPKQNWKATTSN